MSIPKNLQKENQRMEKKRKSKFQKFIAILCIIVLLQSYLPGLAQIAIATNEELSVVENEQENEETVSTPDEDNIVVDEETR